jgi:septum site-determining protein MinC
MEETAILLKGTAEGILLRPKSYVWDTVLEALELALREAEEFFRGGRLIVDLGSRELTQEQLVALRALLMQFDIELWAVASEDEKTIRLARSNGILTRLPKEVESRKAVSEAPPEAQALFVRQTLRSGQKIHYPGDVTLLGDVNPGGEIVAGGSILVWGAIRGMAHAGAYGDENVVICALDLQPAQLRIAGYIGRAPEQRKRTAEPEVARVEEGRIVADSWMKKG